MTKSPLWGDIILYHPFKVVDTRRKTKAFGGTRPLRPQIASLCDIFLFILFKATSKIAPRGRRTGLLSYLSPSWWLPESPLFQCTHSSCRSISSPFLPFSFFLAASYSPVAALSFFPLFIYPSSGREKDATRDLTRERASLPHSITA